MFDADHREQSQQLRLTFPERAPLDRVALRARGARISVRSQQSPAVVYNGLVSMGITPLYHPEAGVTIGFEVLSQLAAAPLEVTVDAVLEPLWKMYSHPPVGSMPILLALDPGGTIVASWHDGTHDWVELLSMTSARAVTGSTLPVIAPDNVWETLGRATPMSGVALVGRAHHNGEFIEIAAARPQQAPDLGLPGLFRVSPSVFGVNDAYRADVDAHPQIAWVNTPPTDKPQHSGPVGVHLDLTPHILATLPQVVSQVDRLRAQVILWEPGLGRRLLCLATVEALEAYPSLIVTDPAGMWVWARHLGAMERTVAVDADSDADVCLVPYEDVHTAAQQSVQSIIFEDLAGEHPLDRIADTLALSDQTEAIRLAVSDTWPDDPTAQYQMLSIVRPAEFDPSSPLAMRYPGYPALRFAEHAAPFLNYRTHVDVGRVPAMRRSAVCRVDASDRQHADLVRFYAHPDEYSPADHLARLIELTTAGSSQTISPKLVEAVGLVRTAHHAGHSVAVVVRSPRAAMLLSSLIRPLRAVTVDADDPFEVAPVVIVSMTGSLGNLTAFDQVVILDYPWSFKLIDEAVGASNIDGPDVVVVHMRESVDDRLAILAARRSNENNPQPPDHTDVHTLLTPRVTSETTPRPFAAS